MTDLDDILDEGMMPVDVDETVDVLADTPRKIYAYTHSGFAQVHWERENGAKGVGLIKVGTTTRDTVVRLREQLQTAFPDLVGVDILLKDEPARRTDGTYFSDSAVHRVLKDAGIRRVGGEWFEATIEDVTAAIAAVRRGKGLVPGRTADFPMRPEQEKAVTRTAAYFDTHRKAITKKTPRFLWNAKMRFGKTFTAYQLAREMGWRRLLVLTFKPAVQAQWRDDLVTHVDFAEWEFVDRATHADEVRVPSQGDAPFVWFASFQDLMGRTSGGAVKAHNEFIHEIEWDCIILDEYHFGAWRESSRVLYDPTDRKDAEAEEPAEPVTEQDLGLETNNLLYLSGTPFRALTNGEFDDDAVYTWTYTDEQAAKAKYDGPEPNPYADLPTMEMYAYQISDQAAQFAEDEAVNEFNLSEYFRSTRVKANVRVDTPCAHEFEDPTRVLEFVEMLRGKLIGQLRSLLVGKQKSPWPYEDATFANAVKHSVWYMSDVAACYAMRDMLLDHAYFSSFEIVVVAGTASPNGVAAKSLVTDAISRAARDRKSGTITLTCGKLMTGVTVKQWGAILMLRSLKAPESYFQAAFRVQSPWASRDGEELEEHKPTVYIFEFDPNRALALVADYGLRLAARAGADRGTVLEELLNYLPIYRFEGGRMGQLDASEMLDIATIKVGARALANRWNSPVLVSVNDFTLQSLLDHPHVMEALSQAEDFTGLPDAAGKIITSTTVLKNARRQERSLTGNEKKQVDEAKKLRTKIREMLQQFCAKVPTFMYVTDFREEALVDVIDSLDSDLFERVTGLTVDDFRLLNEVGVFNREHMDSAIYQFRRFEDRSLHYADEDPSAYEQASIGLWHTTTADDARSP